MIVAWHRYMFGLAVVACALALSSETTYADDSATGTIAVEISRVPGVARSLRVLVPTALLPDSDFGSRRGRTAQVGNAIPASSPVDIAVMAAMAVIDAVVPSVDPADAPRAVMDAAGAVRASLLRTGLAYDQAEEAARRVAAEVARRQPDGRGTVVARRHWVRR